MDSYFVISATIFSVVWAIVTLLCEVRKRKLERKRTVVDRLHELLKIGVEYPEVPKYLSKTAWESEEFFRDVTRQQDDDFFMSKSYMYTQLDLFEELLISTRSKEPKFSWLIGRSAYFEITEWEDYLIHLLSHPLCRSIQKHEDFILGDNMQAFFDKNRSAIMNKAE